MIDSLRLNIDRWNLWLQQSANRRIFLSMGTVGGLTGLSYLLAFFKELVVAYRFGRGEAMDALLIALLLPSTLLGVIAGPFQSVFIPAYMQVREKEGDVAVRRLIANATAGAGLLLAAVSVLLASGGLVPLFFLSSGFDPEKALLTRSLFFILLPLLALGGAINLWTAILNAQEHFALPTASALIPPIGTVLVLFLLNSSFGIYALAVGIITGSALQAGLLAFALRRRGIPVLPRWHGMDAGTRQIIDQYAPMLIGALLMSGTTLIDQSMAAWLGSGSVAAISYGNKLVALILGIGTMVLGTVMLPHFSQMVAVSDWIGVRRTLKTYVQLILVVTVPVTVCLVYFSADLVALVFERGAFTQADSQLVGQVQAFYLLQVPFYMVGILGVRLLSALRKNHILVMISGVNLVTNAVGNYLFMQYWGVAGIGLSTSMVYVISVGLIFSALSRQIPRRERA